MKVYQALKEKKQIISAIAQLSKLIRENNSTLEENEFEFNLNELFEKRNKKVEELIDLKFRLAKTAVKIQESIFRMAELKTELALLNEINTTQGSIESYSYGFDQIVVKRRKVQLSKVDVIERVEAIIAEINKTQAKIDEFNYSTNLL